MTDQDQVNELISLLRDIQLSLAKYKGKVGLSPQKWARISELTGIEYPAPILKEPVNGQTN